VQTARYCEFLFNGGISISVRGFGIFSEQVVGAALNLLFHKS